MHHKASMVNSSSSGQNGRHFADDIFKWYLMNEKFYISMRISLKFVPEGPNDNKSTLVQVMAWCQTGDKSLPEPICHTRGRWVKKNKSIILSTGDSGLIIKMSQLHKSLSIRLFIQQLVLAEMQFTIHLVSLYNGFNHGVFVISLPLKVLKPWPGVTNLPLRWRSVIQLVQVFWQTLSIFLAYGLIEIILICIAEVCYEYWSLHAFLWFSW